MNFKDPKIAAVAAAVMQEEEDRELAEAMEATGLAVYYPDDYVESFPYRSRSRMMSLGNVSAPPTINPSGRFSSISTFILNHNFPRRNFNHSTNHNVILP